MEALIVGIIIGLVLANIAWKREDDPVILCGFGAALSMMFLIALVLFVISHKGNHISVEPWILATVFVPAAFLGAQSFCRSRFHPASLLAVLSGAGGMAYLAYIDSTNRLLSYIRWIARGMPPVSEL
jgi:hypothetical protein